jgi:NAD:arginine ADP-ribosyltransferase
MSATNPVNGAGTFNTQAENRADDFCATNAAADFDNPVETPRTPAEAMVYDTGPQTRAALEARLAQQQTPPAENGDEEGLGAFLEGVVAGDFSDDQSWSATVGRVIGGLNPLADARDIAAGIYNVATGKEGAWVELGAATLGAVPVIGDAGKAAIRVGRRAVREGAEEGAERVVREGAEELTGETAERVARETAERQAVDLANPAYRSTPEVRAQFRASFGETRYQTYAGEIDAARRADPELQGVPTEDLVAVRGYTSDDYRELNTALRTGDTAELSRLDAYIRSATSGLNQLPAYRGTVFRGTNLSDEAAANYVPGATVTERAFTSTSSELGAEFPGNTKFVIQSETGRDVSRLSEFADEEEVLFAPGTQFRVLGVDVDAATGRRTIYMREVPRGGDN